MGRVLIGALWILFLFRLPFGEGSGSPAGLLVAHVLFLAALLASVAPFAPWRAGRGKARDRPATSLWLPSLALLAAAGLSGAAGPYRFASLLAVFDLAVLLGVVVFGERLARSDPPLRRPWLTTIALAGGIQGILIVGPCLLGGFAARGPGTLLNSDHAAAYLLLALWALVAAASTNGKGSSEHPAAAASTNGEGSSEHPAAAAVSAATANGMGVPVRIHGPTASATSSTAQGRHPLPPVTAPAPRRDRTLRVAAVLLAGLMLAALLLQASRGAFLALAAGCAVYASLRFREMPVRMRWASAAGALGILALAGALLAHRLTSQADPYRWDRARIWMVALRVAADHPILGAGPGLFPYVTAPYDLAHDAPVRYAKHVEATHSDYLRVTAETGALGTLALLLLLSVLVRRGWKAVREGGAVEAALAAAVGGLLVQAAVENLSDRPAVSYTGAALVALLLAGSHRERRASGRPGDGATGSVAVDPERRGTAARSAAPEAEPASAHREGVRSPGSRLEWRGILGTVLLSGGVICAGLALVVAPYLGDRAFDRFRKGGPLVGAHHAAAVFWNPIHPDYRAALAEAVVAAGTPRSGVGAPARAAKPGDLAAGFRAIDGALALKPIDPRYYLVRARLARRGFASSGHPDWIAMASKDYDRAALLDPLRPLARVERGWMLLERGGREEALEEARRSLLYEPNYFDARRLEAAALIELGLGEEARAAVSEARERWAERRAVAPSNAYETQILRWDVEGWAEVDARLARVARLLRSASEPWGMLAAEGARMKIRESVDHGEPRSRARERS